jgi:hypothetical protein
VLHRGAARRVVSDGANERNDKINLLEEKEYVSDKFVSKERGKMS